MSGHSAAAAVGAGAGNGSPSITPMIFSTPSEMPPEKSPFRNFGVMISLMMRLAVTSVRLPSRPYPTSMRSLRSSLATTRSAPSSIFLRPIFQASATRIEYCSMVSGCRRRHDQHRDLAALAQLQALSGFASATQWCRWTACRSDRPPAPTAAAPRRRQRRAKAQHISSASREALAAIIAVDPVALLPKLLGRRRVEIHLRRGRDFLLIVDREIGLLFITEAPSPSGCSGRCGCRRYNPAPT